MLGTIPVFYMHCLSNLCTDTMMLLSYFSFPSSGGRTATHPGCTSCKWHEQDSHSGLLKPKSTFQNYITLLPLSLGRSLHQRLRFRDKACPQRSEGARGTMPGIFQLPLKGIFICLHCIHFSLLLEKIATNLVA